MKKFKATFILFLTSILMMVLVYYTGFYLKGPDVYAKSYILINADTEKTLIGKNVNQPFAAASMTKLMTEYLVLKSIHEGKLHWEDEVTITDQTAYSEGVKINVEPGTTLTVRDLYSSMVVASANNAAVALAVTIAGSEEAFTSQMNTLAKELGLSDQTHFVNATGLANAQNEESQMTAKDVALLADHLISQYPEVLETTKLQVYHLKLDGTALYSTNKMLYKTDPAFWVEGVDGLKTGFTDKAGYCFTGTAKLGNKRLISVVMGTEETDTRFIETKKLFAYGFQKPFVPNIKAFVKAQFINHVAFKNG